MSALQQLRQMAAQLGRAFDQQIADLPILGSLFQSKWNIIQNDLSGGFLLLGRDGPQKIPEQIKANQIKGRNCLRLSSGSGQIRKLRLPNAAMSDPASAIRLSLDTLSPMAPEDTAFAIQATEEIKDSDTFNSVIALTSKSRMKELIAQAQRLGLNVAAVDVADPEHLLSDPVINLLTGQRASATMSPSKTLLFICGALLFGAFSLNLWAAWKLEPELALLKAQSAPVDNATARVQRTKRLSRLSITETWSTLSKALPDSAWVESLIIDKTEMRLAGHASNAAELVGALETSPALKDVGLAAASVQEADGRESFDLKATITASGGL